MLPTPRASNVHPPRTVLANAPPDERRAGGLRDADAPADLARGLLPARDPRAGLLLPPRFAVVPLLVVAEPPAMASTVTAEPQESRTPLSAQGELFPHAFCRSREPIDRTEPEFHDCRLRTPDGGEADIYGPTDGESFDSLAINHFSPGEVLDLVARFARQADAVVLAPGCPAFLTAPSRPPTFPPSCSGSGDHPQRGRHLVRARGELTPYQVAPGPPRV
ncbi:hypothetical protein [Amycolatopsis sp. GM8]|uniref:hypothetical protein n=1 Tax=Amycolatopsis sp. GM8 TaxID=2896530 RepID=UPI001F373555|nr:hypothetical protein [Amycolatopsis sp. GM8]